MRRLAGHVAAAGLVAMAASPAMSETWRDVFQSSPASYDTAPRPKGMEAFGRNLATVTGTVRYRLVVSAGGDKVRVRISNEERETPLVLGGASVGLSPQGYAATGALKPLTFGGSRTITIPPGAPALSDPVDLRVAAGGKLVVSLYLPQPTNLETAGQSAGLVAPGDQTLSAELKESKPIEWRSLVTGVSVSAATPPRVIAALGDSITDGNRTEESSLHSWPEQLSRRLNARTSGAPHAVVSAGIGGNRLISPGWGAAGIARLDRDVLRLDGLSHIIVLEGTNDIGMARGGLFGDEPPVTADALIAGYRQVISRGHARGAKVVIGTITPTRGSIHFTPEKEEIRQAVNRWIRTSGEPDAVIDFDLAIRDPKAPDSIAAPYSTDKLHPNDAGYAAMGDAIDLKIFD